MIALPALPARPVSPEPREDTIPDRLLPSPPTLVMRLDTVFPIPPPRPESALESPEPAFARLFTSPDRPSPKPPSFESRLLMPSPSPPQSAVTLFSTFPRFESRPEEVPVLPIAEFRPLKVCATV